MENFLIEKIKETDIEMPTCTLQTDGFTRWGHNKKYWILPVGDGYVFGDWSSGEKHYAFPDDAKDISPAQRLATDKELAIERAKFMAEEQSRQIKIAETAKNQFEKMQEAPKDHPYLEKKHISTDVAKFNPDSGSLVVPLYDTDGKMWSLQYIGVNGDKRFLSGGRKKGCFCPLGEFNDVAIICEGFATACSIYEATGYYTVAAMDAGNLIHVAKGIRTKYPEARLLIAADNDWEKENNVGVDKANMAAEETNADVCIPRISTSGLSDFNDVAISEGLESVKKQITAKVSQIMKPMNGGYRVLYADEFLTKDLPKTEFLLYPFIPKNGLSLMYAERGAGKTFMALAMACAVASGFDFLNFKAEKAYRVLYVDGEMDAREMQDRLNLLIRGFASEGKIVNTENLRLFLSGLQDLPSMPDLATKQGQKRIEAYLKDVDLVIIDNIFSLYTAGRENDADSWTIYNAWSRRMRSQGKSVLWLHHTGKDKSRGPRGSSAIEAILNASIALEVSPSHTPSNGAEVTIEYHKSRGVSGDDVRAFNAKLENLRNLSGELIGLKWIECQSKYERDLEVIRQLHKSGKKILEIADETGISKSTVQRRVAYLNEQEALKKQ